MRSPDLSFLLLFDCCSALDLLRSLRSSRGLDAARFWGLGVLVCLARRFAGSELADEDEDLCRGLALVGVCFEGVRLPGAFLSVDDRAGWFEAFFSLCFSTKSDLVCCSAKSDLMGLGEEAHFLPNLCELAGSLVTSSSMGLNLGSSWARLLSRLSRFSRLSRLAFFSWRSLCLRLCSFERGRSCLSFWGIAGGS